MPEMGLATLLRDVLPGLLACIIGTLCKFLESKIDAGSAAPRWYRLLIKKPGMTLLFETGAEGK